MNIAIFASGQGSNFSAIVKTFEKTKTNGKIVLLVCDNPQARVIRKAERSGIKTAVIPRNDFSSKRDFEKKITQNLNNSKISLIILAGFMRLLSPEFVKLYAGRIINIHPSLLPAFKGEHGIQDAFDYGAKVTGVTVHFVDEKMDHGPIILQGIVEIKENDTLESLEAKIHKLEHKLYPRAIKLFLEGKLKISGRKTRIAIQ